MRWTSLFLAMIAAALAGCARDNPDNVPLYGDWEMTTKIGSLSVDGLAVPPEYYPLEFKQLEKSEQRCGEPMFIDRDWQQQDIDARVKGKCTLTSYNVTPTLVTGKGKCVVPLPEGDFKPDLDLRINQAPDKYRMVVTIKGTGTIPGYGPRFISATAVQEAVRSGDCS